MSETKKVGSRGTTGLWNSSRRNNWTFNMRSTGAEFPNYGRLQKLEKVGAPVSITEVLYAQRSADERIFVAAQIRAERESARALAIDASPFDSAEEDRIAAAKRTALDVVTKKRANGRKVKFQEGETAAQH